MDPITLAATVGDIEDSWSRWEFPTLLALARVEQSRPTPAVVMRGDVIRLLGVADDESWKVGRALDRLAKGGYIEAQQLMDGTGWPGFVIGLTPKGLRHAGVWPNPESFQRDLIAQLNAAADRLAEVEPARATKVRSAIETLTETASDVLAKVVAELFAKAAGL